MSEKPLHARVAGALDLKGIGIYRLEDEPAPGASKAEWVRCDDSDGGEWYYYPDGKWLAPIPHYDTDWSATGPLIEKYGIRLYEPGYAIGEDRSMWTADIADGPVLRWQCWGRTPLLAICGLIVSRAGKLKAA